MPRKDYEPACNMHPKLFEIIQSSLELSILEMAEELRNAPSCGLEVPHVIKTNPSKTQKIWTLVTHQNVSIGQQMINRCKINKVNNKRHKLYRK